MTDISSFSEHKVEQTADGSPTIYLPLLDEHYHSVKGAMTESVHIYVRSGLEYHQKSSLRVLEIGFGTGLNALASILSQVGKLVEYFTLERFPLKIGEVEAAGYLSMPGGDLLRAMHTAEWGHLVEITPTFHICKIECDLTDSALRLPSDIDIAYIDAFAPEKQPEMWSEEIFRRIYEVMNPGGILMTYCAKGAVRRLLQAVGFTVERIPGPPAGKREILRATK